jgi:hypothetical protein
VDTQASDAATGVLSNLVAADLVTHEMIGDPSRLESEAACLRALCSVVGGSVYRLDPFHYAFRAGPLDLGGRLGDAGPGDWAAELEAALQGILGADALWISATPPAPRLVRAEEDGDAGTRAPVAYLRAFAGAAGGLEPPEPGLRAVIDARYAAEIARLTAGAAPGEALDGRLSGLEARLDAMAQSMVSILARLEASETRLERLLERDGGAAFQDNVGLALAEFLSRLERNAETGRAAAPARETAPAPLSAALGV